MWRFTDDSYLERKLQEKEERIQFLESRLAYVQDLCGEYKKEVIAREQKIKLLEAELEDGSVRYHALKDENRELQRRLDNRVKVVRCCKRGGCCR